MPVAALSTKNPYYIQRELDWVMMRDAYEGERNIKDKAQAYLPPTRQMLAEGLTYNQPGWHAYQAYRTRAVYHELVKPALMAMMGVMHRKGPDVQLPPKLDAMRKKITFDGNNIDWLLQKVNEQQMLMGRYGLFLDVQTGAPASALPYVVGYDTENIINWDSTIVSSDKGMRALELVVLNESGYERAAGLAWSQKMRFRVLARKGAISGDWADLPGTDNQYVGLEVESSQSAPGSDFIIPALGGRTLDAVPFVFVGPRDLVPEPDMPVLMPLARIALAIYRTEADYRQALYMQGQDTLVVVGQQAQAEGKTVLGAFGSIDLPMGGSAEYIGADSGGLQEMGNAIQNDLKRASQLGAQLLSERGNEAEAGEALAIRVASRTATLTTVAQSGCGGVEQILKNAAIWVGADPDKVIVKPNMDFADDPAQAQDLVYLMTAKNMGLPLSKKSVHGWMQKREFTDKTFEDEQKELDDEGPPLVPASAGGVRGVAGASFAPAGSTPPKASTVAKAAA